MGDSGDADPVTLEPFVTPVVASDGNTYELGSLREWVGGNWKRSSPLTRETLRPVVFWNERVAFVNGLVAPKAKQMLLYDPTYVVDLAKCDYPVIECTIWLGSMAYLSTPWISSMLEAKGLLGAKMCLSLVLEPVGEDASVGNNGKPRVVGYKVATNLEAMLDSFCKAFSLGSMCSECVNIASAPLFVENARGYLLFVCTVEELLNDPVSHVAWDKMK